MVLKKNEGLPHNLLLIFKGMFYSDYHLFLIYIFYANLLLAIYFYIKLNKILSYICLVLAISQYAMCIFYDERYKKLQKRNYLLANCMDSLPSLFLVLDKDWQVVFANDIFQAFSIGKTLSSFEDVLDCFSESANLCEVLKTGRSTLLTEPHFCQNISIDENKSWRIYMGVLKKSNKNFYVCYISDIEETNALKEKNLQNIVNDLPEGICIYDYKNIVYMNTVLSSMLKTNNISLSLVLEDMNLHHHKKHFTTSYKTDKDTLLLKFEKIKESDVIVYRVHINENIIKNMSIHQDDNSILGVVLMDTNLNIIDANNKFNNLVNSYFVKKTNLLQYVEPSCHNNIKQYLKDKSSKNIAPIDVTLGDKSGNLVKFHCENLDNIGWIVFLQDNNIQKELETQLLHSQRLGLLGQVLSAVSHDFNNILTAIGGFCDMLCTKISVMDEKYFAIIQIKHNINRAVNLVKYILYLSRKNTPSLNAETNVHENISHLLSNMGRLLGENTSINFIKSNKNIVAKIPSINLEQILLNLIVNARDSMKNGGVITVSTNLIQDISLLDLNNNEQVEENQYYLELSVSDTGEGISEQNKKKIFDSFFTTKREGTGLGLSTIQSIIKQCNGFIKVSSKVGLGTTFKVYLLAFEQTEHNEERIENTSSAEVKRKLLNTILVEDDISIRNLLKEGLKKKSYLNVHAFPSIKTAMECVNKLLANGETVDLVISDIMIADGNGLELVEKITLLTSYTKYVLISGYDKEHLENLKSYNVMQSNSENIVFLQKPFSIQEILVIIGAFYDK